MSRWIVIEIYEDENDDNNVATELLRTEEGAIALYDNEEEAKNAADAVGLAYYDLHDLDLIVPPEAE